MKVLAASAIAGLTALALGTAEPLAAQRGGPARPARPTTGANARPWPDEPAMAERRRQAEQRRLFRSDEPLAITLSADFDAVGRDRDPKSEKTYPATIEFTNDDGTPGRLALRVRTRGYSRRNIAICAFAPLRLDFVRAQSSGTVFEGHGALKLGTHCRPGSEEIVLREYAIYRMFNLLTPNSFRARLARVKYVDARSGRTDVEQYGLLIEDDDDVARRLEGRITTIEQLIFGRLDTDAVSLMMLFEYMVGNTDFSIYVQHNVRVVQTRQGRRYPVPYDFDFSGLVDARYARPAQGLPIGSVRDRLYLGPCRSPAEWQPYFDTLKAKKTDLLALFDTLPGMSVEYRRSAKAYLGEFYEMLDRPGEVKRTLIDPCVKLGM
jgi:hypothetical protein